MIFLQPIKKYAVFSGRATRLEYWSFIVFQWTLLQIIWFLDVGVQTLWQDAGSPIPRMSEGMISGLVVLVLMIPGIAVSVRRLHDINKSGKWALLFVASLLLFSIAFGWYESVQQEQAAVADLKDAYGLAGVASFICIPVYIWFIALMYREGDKGDNRFGPDPKNETENFAR